MNCLHPNCTKGFKYRARVVLHWPETRRISRHITSLYVCGEHKKQYGLKEVVPDNQWDEIIKDFKEKKKTLPNRETSFVEFERI